jgi:hypothetical protein
LSLVSMVERCSALGVAVVVRSWSVVSPPLVWRARLGSASVRHGARCQFAALDRPFGRSLAISA